jgi:arabinofuranan 3-O-arabinosyltransferase
VTLVAERREAPPPPPPTASKAPRPSRVSARTLLVICALLAVEIFFQQSGRIIHETKVDLAMDPLRFLGRIWHLWEPTADMGRVQNQVTGYLFPMGTFYAVGKLLSVPTWILQRLWISLLLGTGLWGMTRLGDEFEVGDPTWRVIGATAYILSPFFLARGATLSAFVIGGALLPWVLIPLVRGSRGGSPRRAACLSAIAVLAMGAANAAVTVAVLIVPALYLLTRQRGPRRARLIRWWVVATSLACAWWAGALVLQAVYGTNFLVYTERAVTTTGVTPPFEVLRGTADWLSYVYLWNVSLPAGLSFVTVPILVLATALVAAGGIYGLTRTDLPERTFLIACFLLGVAAVGLGYGGLLGDPVAGPVRVLLDGPLGVFRTVYKFEPLIGFALAFGLVHAGSTVFDRLGAARRPAGARSVMAPLLAMVVVLVAAGPLLTGGMAANGGFTAEPAYWTAAKEYVQDHGGRTLEVPGLPIADFSWGEPEDDPFQWGTDASFATRSLAPLGSSSATRYLDGVETAISQGGDPGLAASLRRGGFSTVTARNDASAAKYLAPLPAETASALTASGLHVIASFGPQLQLPADQNPSHLVMHLIDVYGVPGGSEVSSYPIADAAVVSGGPASPLDLASAGGPARGYVLAQDLTPGTPAPPNWIVTDGNALRFNYFGLNRNNASYVLSPTDPSPTGQPLSAGLLPSDRIADQTVAEVQGVRSITASSTGSWLLAIPEDAPYNILDGDPSTAWVAGPIRSSSVGQWVQVNLAHPIRARTMKVNLLEDGPWRPKVTALTVTTAAGSVVDRVHPDESTQTIALPRGATTWIRVTFSDELLQSTQSAGAGIRALSIPGVTMTRRLLTPSQLNREYASPSRPLPQYSFHRYRTNPHSLVRSDEETAIRRDFVAPHAGTMDVSAGVAADPGPWLQSLVDSAGVAPGSGQVVVSASSALRNLPEYAARNLVDGDTGTIWVSATAGAAPQSYSPVPAQSLDKDPHVSMTWGPTRSVDSLKLETVAGYSTPAQVNISDGTTTRHGTVQPDGTVRFDAPLVTNHLDITFPKVNQVVVLTGDGRRDLHPLVRPVGLAAIDIPALKDLYPGRINSSTKVEVSCADGPVVRIDQQDVHLSVSTTIGALTKLGTIPAQVCAPTPVAVTAGHNTVDSSGGAFGFNVNWVTLEDSQHPIPAEATPRTVTQGVWTSDHRSVKVGPGPASYLVVNENVNKGWVATLDGHDLKPVVLDGWRQGYIVPAGSGGLVTLRYTPDAPLHAVLVVGGLLVLLLFGVALLPVKREPQAAPIGPGTWATPLLWVVALGCAFVVAGPATLLVVPLWFLARRRTNRLGIIAVAAYVAAALWVSATLQPFHSTWFGAFGWPATVLALVALLAVVTSLLLVPATVRSRRPWSPRHAA